MNGKHRVEKVGEVDALSLGHQPEKRAVAVEAPRPAFFGDLEIGFAVPVEEFVADVAGRVLVGQLKRIGPEPLDIDNGDDAVRQDAANRAAGFEVFKPEHSRFQCAWSAGRSCRPPLRGKSASDDVYP